MLIEIASTISLLLTPTWNKTELEINAMVEEKTAIREGTSMES